MERCRNCGGSKLRELGFTGMLAPFFLKRVFGMRLGIPASASRVKRFIRAFAAVPQRWLDRLNRPAVFIEMQLCEECSFIQTKEPFQEAAINRLYADYRSDSYNAERIAYEPSYASIAESVGAHQQELDVRVSAATRFLLDKVRPGENFTILDYGGADGKFLPRIEAQKFVFEISDVKPIEGVTRIRREEDMTTYSLVQLTHVIEHVVEPLQLVKRVGERVEPGGYLYLETPEELSAGQRAALQSGGGGLSIPIHEHINSYCVPAVTRLIEQAGFGLVAVESSPVDVGWGSAVHIRALGIRKSA